MSLFWLWGTCREVALWTIWPEDLNATYLITVALHESNLDNVQNTARLEIAHEFLNLHQ